MFCGSLHDGHVPEGQAVASNLLAQCYGLVETIKDTAGVCVCVCVCVCSLLLPNWPRGTTSHRLPSPPHSLIIAPSLAYHRPLAHSPLPPHSLTIAPSLAYHRPLTRSPSPPHSLTLAPSTRLPSPSHSLTIAPSLAYYHRPGPHSLTLAPCPSGDVSAELSETYSCLLGLLLTIQAMKREPHTVRDIARVQVGEFGRQELVGPARHGSAVPRMSCCCGHV